MLSDLTKILDRNYIVGYFLPALLFITVSFLLMMLFIPEPTSQIAEALQQSKGNISIEANDYLNPGLNVVAIIDVLRDFWTFSAVIVIIFSLSILLMVLNRFFIRFLEGYGFLQKLKLHRIQMWKYDRDNRSIEKLNNKYLHEEKIYGSPSQETAIMRMKEMYSFRLHYPKDKNDVLATGFGNAVRAFEVYSKVRYGVDSIPVWSRIISVVPNDKKESLNASKAQVDFAVNVIYLSLFALIEYLCFSYYRGSFYMVPLPIIILIIIWRGYSFAISSAISWGEDVKAVFDLYRIDLLTKMGIDIPGNSESERECWREINQSFLYWDDFDSTKVKRLNRKIKINRIFKIEHETSSYVEIEPKFPAANFKSK